MDAATILQNAERRLCSCGAAGSGEEHEPWCRARKFDLLPENISADDAVRRLRIGGAGYDQKL